MTNLGAWAWSVFLVHAHISKSVFDEADDYGPHDAGPSSGFRGHRGDGCLAPKSCKTDRRLTEPLSLWFIQARPPAPEHVESTACLLPRFEEGVRKPQRSRGLGAQGQAKPSAEPLGSLGVCVCVCAQSSVYALS